MRKHGRIGLDTDLLMRLEVRLTDGRVLSGTYGWLEAHARAEFARTLPSYSSHILTEAQVS